MVVAVGTMGKEITLLAGVSLLARDRSGPSSVIILLLVLTGLRHNCRWRRHGVGDASENIG